MVYECEYDSMYVCMYVSVCMIANVFETNLFIFSSNHFYILLRNILLNGDTLFGVMSEANQVFFRVSFKERNK